MRDSWTGYNESKQAECVYCGKTKDYIYETGMVCECGMEWIIPDNDNCWCNSIDDVLEMKRM